MQTGADAQRVAGLLKQHDVPVILSSVLSMPPGEDDVPRLPVPGAGRAREGRRAVRVLERRLRVLAQRAVPGGMRRRLGPVADDAIKALTIDAARIFGADSQVGSIEAGKIANLVVVNGDPLEIRSQIQHVVIAGRDVSLDSTQVELFKRYMSR